jgi:hypothetical protein
VVELFLLCPRLWTQDAITKLITWYWGEEGWPWSLAHPMHEGAPISFKVDGSVGSGNDFQVCRSVACVAAAAAAAASAAFTDFLPVLPSIMPSQDRDCSCVALIEPVSTVAMRQSRATRKQQQQQLKGNIGQEAAEVCVCVCVWARSWCGCAEPLV